MRGLFKLIWFRSIIVCLALAIFILIPCHASAARGMEIESKDDLSHKSGKLGEYKALVIGINNYQDSKIPALKTAVNDATELANVLKTMYGFEVTLLLDRQATRQAIMDKMRNLAANSSPDESILIYYAGHGEVDRVLNDGWWVPVDATGGNPSTYLDNNYVQRVMRGMKARHVLLISDSCYSGTLFGENRSLPKIIDDRYYLNLYNEKSRWGMTSGNKTPVSDNGSEGHSIFAYQLIKALRKNERPYFTTQELYNRIAPIVANNSEQQPLCSPIRDTGDQGGGFVFVALTSSAPQVSTSSSYRPEAIPRQDSEELQQQAKRLEKERQELESDREEIAKMEALDTERKGVEAQHSELIKKKQQLAMATGPSVSTLTETNRDGRFIAYSDKTVLDANTHLMWAAKDSGSDKTWQDAKSYCENYRGGGYSDWRMPTQDELAGLYENKKNTYGYHVTELIEITQYLTWASDTRGSEAAEFSFLGGHRYWRSQSGYIFFKVSALPVRLAK